MPGSDLEVAGSFKEVRGQPSLVCTLGTALPPLVMATWFPLRRLNDSVFLALRLDQARHAEVEATKGALEPNCQGSPQLCLFLAI